MKIQNGFPAETDLSERACCQGNRVFLESSS